MQRIFVAAFALMLIIGVASSAAAHHSFAAFNVTAEKTITGTVKSFEWTNPHTWIFIDVANDKGGVDTWGVEGMSPNYLARRGWSKMTFTPGEKVTVTVRPMKDGSNGGMFVKATLASGRELTFSAEPTDR